MRRTAALGLILILAAVGPAWSQSATSASQSVERLSGKDQATLAGALDALKLQQFAKARRGVETLLKANRAPAIIMHLQMVLAVAAFGEGRLAQGVAALKAAQAADPSAPEPLTLTVGLAPSAGEVGLAAAALGRMIDQHASAVAEVEIDTAFQIVRWLDDKKRGGEADALRIGLALHGAREGNAELLESVAAQGAKAAVRQKKLGIAATLATKVQTRPVLLEMLTDRAYEPLWPAIENAAGDRMSTAQSGSIASARLSFDAEESIATRHSLMNAYLGAARLAEADRIGAGFAPSAESLAQQPQEAGWLINDHALVLRAAGRVDAMDARMAQLASLDIRERPWMINFLINRGSWLVRAGRFADALAPVAAARAQLETYGSGYAKQLVRRDELCARHGIDGKADTSALLAELKANERDGPEALVGALHCLGRTAEAEEVVVRALEGDQFRGAMIDALQPAAVQRDRSPSIWEGAWTMLRARPAVAAAFEKVGRTLPERFWLAAR